MENKFKIVSSVDENCLRRLITHLGFHGLEVYVDDTSSTLLMQEELWNDLQENSRFFILDFSLGFVSGWEAARE